MTGAVPSLITLSEDGRCAAQIDGNGLSLHLNPTSESRQADIVQGKHALTSTAKFLKISHHLICEGKSDDVGIKRRLLCAKYDQISVWQGDSLLEPVARIEGVDPAIETVNFGSDQNEVAVFHAWNTRMTIFSLDTAHSYVIKAPKFAHGHGFGYRPRTGQLAILLKPETIDVLTIHEAHTYELINRASLPTVDAKGVKWSPDGRWIAVWETASAGTKVLIFTADGHHFATYTGSAKLDGAFDLGVRGIEWSPIVEGEEASEFLAVGKVDGAVDILQSKTVDKDLFAIPHYIPELTGLHSSHAPCHCHTYFNLTSKVL